MKLRVKHFFDAAHQLQDTDDLITKGCANLHGHTYAVIVEAAGKQKSNGMIVDFKAIKLIIDRLDHVFINDIIEAQPTAENIGLWIKHTIETELNLTVNVEICEGYKGIERSSWVVI